MNRRAFFQRASLGAVSAGLAAAVAPAIGANGIVFAVSKPGVHVLGETPSNPDERLFKGMSDDVFRRLTEAFRGQWRTRTMRVIDAERVGDIAEEGMLAYQWNTSIALNTVLTGDRPPYFDMEQFRYATNLWMSGPICAPYRFGFAPAPANTAPVAEMFTGRRVVGMPHLPHGVLWRVNYVDEDTGLVMRALATLDIMTDEYVARWDVICG